MPQMVTYYRVDLQHGVSVEEKPSGFYRDDPDLGVSVFKNLRKAKAVFTREARAEIQRLRALQKEVGPRTNRRMLTEHRFVPWEPPQH
ncbi:MAG: hypothetical protein ACJ75S_07305 [Solirubrobacterales bacterium]|jgi:hypothetical protein